jgi:NADPH:quinone reductase-like Zn-dependent oxidoreductase
MRAMLCHAWGGPQTLRLGDMPEPHAGLGEVVINVRE